MLRETPHDPQAYFNRGNIYYVSGDFDQALANYSAAINYKSDHIEALVNRGVVYAYCEQYEKGFADFEQAVRIDPSCEAAHYNMGFFKANMGNYMGSVEHYNTVLSLNCVNVNALINRGIALMRTGRADEAIPDYSEAIRLGGEFTAIAYASRAEAYYNSVGDGKQTLEQQRELMIASIADNTTALELNPDMEAVFFNRGLSHYYLNEFKEAIEDFSSALALNPNWDMAYGSRGLAYYQIREKKKAIIDYNAALALNPCMHQVLINRGALYSGDDENEKAVADYTTALELNPNMVEALYSRGIVYSMLDDQEEKSIADFTRAHELSPNDAGVLAFRGLVYYQTGNDKKARADFNASLALDSNNKNALAGMRLINKEKK
jgi:tetratricopeptide (TPR) repeat protein